MQLPRTLAPWASYLGIFPRETSLAIGPLVQRIALAVGSMKARSLSGTGDPDGFDDLARRGSYERLLASEWLLADEAPDEFARRAAMGEHVFLNIARREPSGSRVSMALFDAGPNQIGSPRIAHLAALIVLARRAEASGAQFGWGILQQPEMSILSGVSESTVLLLTEARDTKEASDEDVRRWRSRCDEWKDLDDLWLVGGARIGGLSSSKGMSMLIVRDVIEPEARRLSVIARHLAREPRNVVLDLPPNTDCVRLIRDPFAVSVAAPRRAAGKVAPQSNLIFDSSGVKLFSRAAGGSVISFPIPNSPRAGTGSPKVIYSPGQVAAVGRVGRTTVVLRRLEWATRIEFAGPGSSRHSVRDYKSVHRNIDYLVSGDGNELHALLRIPGDQVELAAVDDEHSMFRFGAIRRSGRLDLEAWHVGSRVLSATQTRYGVAFVGQEIPGREWRIVFLGQRPPTSRALPFEGAPSAAFFGYGGTLAHQMYGLAAIQSDESQEWFVITQSEDLRFGAIGGRSVVGVTADPWPGSLSLVCLKDDKRTLTLVRRAFDEQPILLAPAEIVDVTVCHSNYNIAYTTSEGEVIVHSLAHRADLCRFQPKEPT
jgi:hypothetical protein